MGGRGALVYIGWSPGIFSHFPPEVHFVYHRAGNLHMSFKELHSTGSLGLVGLGTLNNKDETFSL